MLLFITVSVLVVSANAIVYSDCGYFKPGLEKATVQKVSVSGCAEDAEVCVLKRNTDITFSIDFTPDKDVTSVESLVLGEDFSEGWVTFPQPQPDGCRDSGLICPLSAGQPASLQTIVPIQELQSQVTLPVFWELTDENDERLTCITFTAKIE